MGWGDFNPVSWVQPVAQTVRQVASDVGTSATNLYKDVATAQNLAYLNPGAALVSDAGRQAVLQTYGKYAAPVVGMFGGPAGAGAAGLAGNVLGGMPADGVGSWLANLLGGQQPAAPRQQNDGGAPFVVAPPAQSAGTPAWVLPAAIAAGAVALVLALRK
jgi:hypothetical protein